MDSLLVSTSAIRNGRRKMEDKHVVIHDLNAQCNLNTQKRYSFYAVYDGHGGVDAANFCAENLHQILCKTRSFNEGNIEKALRETFKETDRLFCSSLLKTQSGCTAIVCLREITHDDSKQVKLHFSWAGDSQAVLVRDGTAIDVTPPHKPDDDKEIIRIESLGGIVVKSDCYRVNGLLAVSRAIGDASHKPYITSDPDIRVETLTGNEDFMILACDGLWDEIDCDDATQLVYETIQVSSDAEAAAKSVASSLVESARNQGSADNITVIVLFLRSLRDIFPTASFSDSPKIVVNKKEEEKEGTLFGLEPVQFRAKEDGNFIQGYEEDAELKARIAGDSTNAFKNGSVTFPTPLRVYPLPQEIELPSPTPKCLADSTVVETMNSESPSSIPSSKVGEEAIPPPLIKCDSSTLTTTSSSCLVTTPNISDNDLLQFSLTPQPADPSQTSEEIPAPDVKEDQEMETNLLNDVFSPVFSSSKSESKNEDIKIEEEFEETTVTTETVFNPIPMTRTTEKIFTNPNDVTSLLHEFSNENRTNGRSPSPSKVESATREAYSLSSPTGNEKVIRVIGDLSDSLYESPMKKQFKSSSCNTGREIFDQVKETKVFEVDSVINASSISAPLVRVHHVVVDADSTSNVGNKRGENYYSSERKDVKHSSASPSKKGQEITFDSLMKTSVVSSSSEFASSSFQTSSNGLNRAFLDCDSSQNLSKDEPSLKDFSPNVDGKEVNNDYLTFSGQKKALPDMEQISASITKLMSRETKELPNDLKLSTSPVKSSVKRASSPTASSKAKEVSKAKPAITTTIRSRPSTVSGAVKAPITSRSSSVRTTVPKPTVTASAMGPRTASTSRASTTTTAARTSVARTVPKSSLKTSISKVPTTDFVSRPISRTSPPKLAPPAASTKLVSVGLKPKVEPRGPLSSTVATKVKPVLSSTIARTQVKPTTSVITKAAPLKTTQLSRSSASTSSLKPVTSKVDSGLSSMKTVRLNVPASVSGLKSSSTSTLRLASTNSIGLRAAVKKVEPVRPISRTSPMKKPVPKPELSK